MSDVVLVGGGLANCLLALRLSQLHPNLGVELLEAHDSLGGNHTWSFHQSDISDLQWQWLQPLISKQWPGHRVEFPGRSRTLAGTYASIKSDEFHSKLLPLLGRRVRLNARVKEVTAAAVTLQSGEVIEARTVIDARGFSQQTTPHGFQKFLGLEVELEQPHGLTVPLMMDARVPQLGGFRFLYSLPWDTTRLLIEDTYYSDDSSLDVIDVRQRIHAYAASQGWKIAKVVREESAALPIPLSGDAPRFSLPTAGVAAGLFNMTTGYSLPWAVELADLIAARTSLDSTELTRVLQQHAITSWNAQSFYRLLNRMLFRGALPEERVRIFESFYGHDEALISRFYAGELNAFDKLKVLAKGAPTVPGPRAVRAALGT